MSGTTKASYTIEPTVVDGRFMWKVQRWRSMSGITALPTFVVGVFPSILDAEAAIEHMKTPTKVIE